MLDTCICIEVIRRRDNQILKRLAACDADEAGVSTIVLAELLHGAMKSARPGSNELAVAYFCAFFEVVSFDDEAAAAYGDVRAKLERAGSVIGPMDMLIAAHAMSLDATVVTNNEREFRRVRGLRVENWT